MVLLIIYKSTNKNEIMQKYRIEKLKPHNYLDDFDCEKKGLE